MKNFNLDNKIVAYSDDETLCLIRAVDFPSTPMARSCTIYSAKREETQAHAEKFIKQFQTRYIRNGEMDYPAVHPPCMNHNYFCVVRAEALRKAKPEWFMPSDNDLLDAYTFLQRNEMGIKNLTKLDNLAAASLAWTKAVKERVRPDHKPEIGNEIKVYCDGDW